MLDCNETVRAAAIAIVCMNQPNDFHLEIAKYTEAGIKSILKLKGNFPTDTQHFSPRELLL